MPMLPDEHKILLTVKGRIHDKGSICRWHCSLMKHTHPCTKKSLDPGRFFYTVDAKGMQCMHYIPSNLLRPSDIANANISCKAMYIHRFVHLPQQETSKSLSVPFRKASSSKKESWESKQCTGTKYMANTLICDKWQLLKLKINN